MKLKNRIVAGLVSVCMLVSMIPTSVFADSYGNISGGSTYVPDLNGTGGVADSAATGVKQHGYQVNIWVADDEDGDGKYDWNSATKINKVSDIQLRMVDLGGFTPAYWVEGGIFEQTTLGYDFYDLYADPYWDDYNFTLWGTSPSQGWDYANTVQAEVKASLEDALEQDPSNSQAQDWLTRIDNINGQSLQEFGFAMAYTNNQGNPPSSSGFIEVESDTTALKDYWMQPAVLDELFRIATEEYGAVDLNVYDFISGVYQGKSAEYKVLIEPMITRQVNYQLVSYTFRDTMMFPSSMMTNGNSALSQLYYAIWWNLTSAMQLESAEEMLTTSMGYLGEHGLVWADDTAAELEATGADLTNTLGVGVITSPMAGDIPTTPLTPQVIKTYVQVTEIDEDGNFTYEYIGEPTVSYLTEASDFLITSFGNDTGLQSNIPTVASVDSEEVTLIVKENGVETGVVSGMAILNDMITTPVSSDGNTDNIRWVTEDLPVINNTQLEASGKDVVSYSLGAISGGSMDVTYASSILSNLDELTAVGYSTSLISQLRALLESIINGSSETTIISQANTLLATDGFTELLWSLLSDMSEEELISLGLGSTWLNVVAGVEAYQTTYGSSYSSIYAPVFNMDTLTALLAGVKIDTSTISGLLKTASVSLDGTKYESKEMTNILGAGIGVVDISEGTVYGLSINESTHTNEDSIVYETYGTFNQQSNPYNTQTRTIAGEDLTVQVSGGSSTVAAEHTNPTEKWLYNGDITLDEFSGMYQNYAGVSETEVSASSMVPANTLVLRYIVLPDPTITHLIEVYSEGDSIPFMTITPSEGSLVYSGDTATITAPDLTGVTGIEEIDFSDMSVVAWVTNYTTPSINLSATGYTLPAMSEGGRSGTTGSIGYVISDYPVGDSSSDGTDAITHNLYVKWKVVISDEGGETQESTVPEWRLSQYTSEITPTAEKYASAYQATMSFTLSSSRGCSSSSDNMTYDNRAYTYYILNPNGSSLLNSKVGSTSSNSSLMDMSDIGKDSVDWVNTKVDSVSSATMPDIYDGSTRSISMAINFTVNQNLVKSTSEMQQVAASWVEKDTATLSTYGISAGYTPTVYTGDGTEEKEGTFLYGIQNQYTYTHTYGTYKHYLLACLCSTSTETFEPDDVAYKDAKYDLYATFDVYKAENTDSRIRTVSTTTQELNGFTVLTYQPGETIKVYPEYGMLFDTDTGEADIKWMIGDEARTIKPVVYQTLEHKVYVSPTTTGNFVTDSTAKIKAASLGYSDLPILYKGGTVLTVFDLYRDLYKNSTPLLTVKTYALDFNDDSGVKATWGNGSYDSASYHTTLLSDIAGTDSKVTADITERLYGALGYVGGDKIQTSQAYQVYTYDNSTVITLTHELIIRSGYVIGVKVETISSSGTPQGDQDSNIFTIEELKTSNFSLYNALIGMDLYDENGYKSNTVLNTFETADGDILSEASYATLLASERASIDGMATPTEYAAVVGKGWYNEDTTTLVVKEYITNYEIPSTSVSDKLPMTVTGLTTPADVSLYYSVMDKGYTYLRYDVDFKVSNANNLSVNAYFEYNPIKSSSGLYRYSSTSSISTASTSIGDSGPSYLIPNVSITDSTY